MDESRGQMCAGGEGAWEGTGHDGSRVGGRGLLTDSRIAALTARCSTTIGALGRGDPPPPRPGESNPDPQRAFSPGEPSWRVVQRPAAAQEGHSALPTPYENLH